MDLKLQDEQRVSWEKHLLRTNRSKWQTELNQASIRKRTYASAFANGGSQSTESTADKVTPLVYMRRVRTARSTHSDTPIHIYTDITTQERVLREKLRERERDRETERERDRERYHGVGCGCDSGQWKRFCCCCREGSCHSYNGRRAARTNKKYNLS